MVVPVPNVRFVVATLEVVVVAEVSVQTLTVVAQLAGPVGLVDRPCWKTIL